MGDNIRRIYPKTIPPITVIDTLKEREKSIKTIYVVTFEDDGEPFIYASGDLNNLCHASVLLQSYAQDFARGLIDKEE